MAMKLVTAAAMLSGMVNASPTPPTAQIVGGTTASSGEFPYIVSLSQGGSHFCGGSLYNANTVITAAHCSVGTSPSSVKVRAGSLSRTSGGTQVSVSQILVHPSYSDSTISNDIALWRLSTPISSNGGTIDYTSLPSQGSDPSAGSSATVAGWGLTSENGSTLPVNLMKVTVPVISRTECRSQYGTSAITTSMFCAAEDRGGKDSCSGDSGGPMVQGTSGSGDQIGIVSWGQGCAEAGYAGVYTRVGQFVDWIEENSW